MCVFIVEFSYIWVCIIYIYVYYTVRALYYISPPYTSHTLHILHIIPHLYTLFPIYIQIGRGHTEQMFQSLTKLGYHYIEDNQEHDKIIATEDFHLL